MMMTMINIFGRRSRSKPGELPRATRAKEAGGTGMRHGQARDGMLRRLALYKKTFSTAKLNSSTTARSFYGAP